MSAGAMRAALAPKAAALPGNADCPIDLAEASRFLNFMAAGKHVMYDGLFANALATLE